MIDYHVHTALCNHATGTMQAFVQKAVDNGFKEICFLDHLTLQDGGAKNSMTPGEVPFYFQEVQTLRRYYAGRIIVRAGLEIDYSPEHTDQIEDIAGTFDFDLIASSLHFLNGENVVSRTSQWSKGTMDNDRVIKSYIEVLAQMLEHDYFDMVCHLDMIKKFNNSPKGATNGAFETLLSTIKEKGIAVEINTSGLFHPVKETYPSPGLIKRCKSLNIPLTLGSDAHAPKQVGQGYDTAFDLLSDAGITQLAVFNKRKQGLLKIK